VGIGVLFSSTKSVRVFAGKKQFIEDARLSCEYDLVENMNLINCHYIIIERYIRELTDGYMI